MMREVDQAFRQGRQYLAKRANEIAGELGENNLWQRMLKNVITTTLLVSIALIPGSENVIGRAAYLGAITTVFGHPGRRFGQMAEALILVVSGTLLGIAWSTLGVYLGSLVIKDYPSAAYSIRGLFLTVVALLHGFLRSRTPRLFLFVLLMIIVSVVELTSTAQVVMPLSVTQILYPILVAVGCITIINVCIFPEFSSKFLGQTTLDALNDTAKAFDNAGQFFIKTPLSYEPELNNSGEVLKNGKERINTNVIEGVQKEEVIEVLKGEALPQPSIAHLVKSKEQIRKKIATCKTTQQECNFELAISVLAPRDLKPISVDSMKRFAASTIAVISACETKFALLGDQSVEEPSQKEEESGKELDERQSPSEMTSYGGPSGHFDTSRLSDAEVKLEKLHVGADEETVELDILKPKREIEFGDARLLIYLLERIIKPYENLHLMAMQSVEVVSACIAYVYDVPKLPSGGRTPKGIMIAELDVHLDSLKQALAQFDADVASALEGAAVIEETKGLEPDIMPREEVFLIASFLLNVRHAVTHIEDMLTHGRELVQRRRDLDGRIHVYAPRIKWSKWLYTGGAEDEAMPTPARKANRHGNANDQEDDEEDASLVTTQSVIAERLSQENIEGKVEQRSQRPSPPQKVTTNSHGERPQESSSRDSEIPGLSRCRVRIANGLEWIQDSEDFSYALKLGVALFLVLWPAFVASWNKWYSLNRGLWAALQLVLITEVSIGTSVMTFFLRGIGTTIGCLWGFAALEARNSNRIVCAVMICIGLFPCVYVQLGTKYPKAGMVCIVSMCVVALAVELQTVPGTPTEDYLKRWIAFMIGGCVALLIEMVLWPVKARTRLVDSLATALRQINQMERCIASGIESGKEFRLNVPENIVQFQHASSKAKTALSAAETFLPFCSTEPRIKGSFEGLALIYGEIIFVLHQVVDRMDNVLQLRTAYGSGPLEELNAEIYPYRRNVAGSISLNLFVVHSALSTRLPLPQYLPSARLAHLRLINRVRDVVLEKTVEGHEHHDNVTNLAQQRILRRKYMSWNATSAAQAEIIEFLEELIDLTKLLVGASEFEDGLLTRPRRGEAERESETGKDEAGADAGEATKEVLVDVLGATSSRNERAPSMRHEISSSEGVTRRRRGTIDILATKDEIPASLRRIQSRKLEAGMKKQKTNESWRQEQQQRL